MYDVIIIVDVSVNRVDDLEKFDVDFRFMFL